MSHTDYVNFTIHYNRYKALADKDKPTLQLDMSHDFFNMLAKAANMEIGNIYNGHGMSICCFSHYKVPETKPPENKLKRFAIPITILWQDAAISVHSMRYQIYDVATYTTLLKLLAQ